MNLKKLKQSPQRPLIGVSRRKKERERERERERKKEREREKASSIQSLHFLHSYPPTPWVPNTLDLKEFKYQRRKKKEQIMTTESDMQEFPGG